MGVVVMGKARWWRPCLQLLPRGQGTRNQGGKLEVQEGHNKNSLRQGKLGLGENALGE